MLPSSCPRADHQGLEARYSGLAVPAGLGLGEVRGVKDMVLDPVCGSGTTAVVAARLDGRFIVIDRELAPVATTPCSASTTFAGSVNYSCRFTPCF